MTDAKDLEAAVKSFRRAEDAIKQLFDETGALITASKKFEEARLDLVAARTDLGELATTHQELSKRLADLTKNLADTTEIIRQVDPARLYSELGNIRQDYQAQIERMGKLSGDLSGKISTSASKTTTQIAESEERVLATVDSVRSQSERLGIAGVVLALAVIGLQVAQLVTG